MCVYLQDGFKVEGEAVPQSELPTGGSGDQAAAFRGPLEEEMDSSNTHNTPTTPPQHTHTLTLITNTGHLTLLVEVRTNFVVTAFMGLFNMPRGGTS